MGGEAVLSVAEVQHLQAQAQRGPLGAKARARLANHWLFADDTPGARTKVGLSRRGRGLAAPGEDKRSFVAHRQKSGGTQTAAAAPPFDPGSLFVCARSMAHASERTTGPSSISVAVHSSSAGNKACGKQVDFGLHAAGRPGDDGQEGRVMADSTAAKVAESVHGSAANTVAGSAASTPVSRLPADDVDAVPAAARDMHGRCGAHSAESWGAEQNADGSSPKLNPKSHHAARSCSPDAAPTRAASAVEDSAQGVGPVAPAGTAIRQLSRHRGRENNPPNALATADATAPGPPCFGQLPVLAAAASGTFDGPAAAGSLVAASRPAVAPESVQGALSVVGGRKGRMLRRGQEDARTPAARRRFSCPRVQRHDVDPALPSGHPASGAVDDASGGQHTNSGSPGPANMSPEQYAINGIGSPPSVDAGGVGMVSSGWATGRGQSVLVPRQALEHARATHMLRTTAAKGEE
jgi:hypothetical protein